MSWRVVVAPVLRRCVAGLLTASAVAGCTGGSVTRRPASEPLTHEQYQQAIQDIVTGDGRTATRLYTEAVGAELTADACDQTVRGLADSLEAVVRSVEDLRPPKEAADIQGRFLDAARESIGLVRKASDDVHAGDLACGRPLNLRIYGLPSTERAQRALEQLEPLGYFVFGD